MAWFRQFCFCIDAAYFLGHLYYYFLEKRVQDVCKFDYETGDEEGWAV